MKKVVKIVTFYDDGTFEESRPYVGAPMPTPYPYYPPTNPWPNPNPNVYPWTTYEVTCKMADGSLQKMEVGPAYATCQGGSK